MRQSKSGSTILTTKVKSLTFRVKPDKRVKTLCKMTPSCFHHYVYSEDIPVFLRKRNKNKKRATAYCFMPIEPYITGPMPWDATCHLFTARRNPLPNQVQLISSRQNRGYIFTYGNFTSAIRSSSMWPHLTLKC